MPRSNRRSFRPSLESLESRVALSVTSATLSGGTLILRSNNAPCQAAVTRSGNKVYATDSTNKFSKAFPASAVKGVQFVGGNGNDKFANNLPGVRTVARGNGGNDCLIGNSANDSLWGGAGNDRLFAFEGDDKLWGDANNDLLYCGDGNDTACGGNHADLLKGEAGNDSLAGEGANDWIEGGDDNDTLAGGLAGDVLHGGDGDDSILGGDGNDYGNGDADNDSIHGDAGNDDLKGGADDDWLEGGTGHDSLRGEAGGDNLFGDAGDDHLFGGDDIDVLSGGDDDDWLEAGSVGELAEGDGGLDWNAHRWVVNGAAIDDVHQRGSSTCSFLASLASCALRGQNLEAGITYEGNHVYAVTLFNGTTWDRYFVEFNGSLTGNDPAPAAEYESWVILYNKAYTQMVGGDGGSWPVRALPALTGHGAQRLEGPVLDMAFYQMEAAIRAGQNVVTSTYVNGGTLTQSPLLVSDHAYTVVSVWRNPDDTPGWVIVRNPWGFDHQPGQPISGANDGYVRLTWAEFQASMVGVWLS